MFNAQQCVVSRRAVCPYHSHASFKDYFQENDNLKSYILSKSLSGLKGYNLLQYFQSIKRALKKNIIWLINVSDFSIWLSPAAYCVFVIAFMQNAWTCAPGLSGSAAVPVCCVSVSGLWGGWNRGGLWWIPYDLAGQHRAHGSGAWTDMETTACMLHQIFLSDLIYCWLLYNASPLHSRVPLCWNLKTRASHVMGKT